jgi:hypothetical protein
VVWAGRLEKLLDVIGMLSRLGLQIALDGSNVFLIRVVHFLAIVVIIVAASSNYDPLGAPLWPPSYCLWLFS